MSALVQALRVSVGTAELTRGHEVCVRVLAHPPDAVELGLVRLLGARHLGQAALSQSTGLLGGPALDVLHALSMIPVAVLSERYRRTALTSMAAAGVFAVLAAVTD